MQFEPTEITKNVCPFEQLSHCKTAKWCKQGKINNIYFGHLRYLPTTINCTLWNKNALGFILCIIVQVNIKPSFKWVGVGVSDSWWQLFEACSTCSPKTGFSTPSLVCRLPLLYEKRRPLKMFFGSEPQFYPTLNLSLLFCSLPFQLSCYEHRFHKSWDTFQKCNKNSNL